MAYRPWMLGLMLGVAIGLVAASSEVVSAQVKPPADFKFEMGQASPGT